MRPAERTDRDTIMETSELFALLRKSKIVHLCFAISFFTSGLIINLTQGILFYGLKPFNKRLYRQIGYYLCYSYFSREFGACRLLLRY